MSFERHWRSIDQFHTMKNSKRSTPSRKSSIIWKVIGIFGALILVAALVGAIWVYKTITPEFVESRVNAALAQSDEPVKYRFEMDDLEVDYLGRNLEMRHLKLIPVPDSMEVDGEEHALSLPHAQVSIQRMRLERIGILPLLTGEKYSSGRLLFEGLDIDLYRDIAQPHNTEHPDSVESIRSIQQRIAEVAPPVTFGSIAIEDANLTILESLQDSSDAITLGQTSLVLNDVELSQEACSDSSRLFFTREIEFDIGRYSSAAQSGLYRFDLHNLRGSTKSSVVELDSFFVTPTLSDAQFQKRVKYQKDRFRHALGGVQLQGLSFQKLLEERALFADGIVIDSVFLDIYKDKRLPIDPNKRLPPRPHEAFQELEIPVHIDSIRVDAGSVTYSEISPDGVRPGKVWFDDVSVEIARICNDEELAECGLPVVVQLAARFMGRGRLKTTFEIPLLSQTFDMNYRGTLSQMPATPVNNILTNLTGFRIEAGQVDGMSFDIEVNNGVAEGDLELAYHDLKMEVINKVSRNKRLVDRLKTFVMKDFLMHSENLADAGDKFRRSEVSYTWEDDPFFRFVWHCLRDGLLDTLKI